MGKRQTAVRIGATGEVRVLCSTPRPRLCPTSPSPMNEREAKIIALREEGKTYAEIGAVVGISLTQVWRTIAKFRPHLTGTGYTRGRNRDIIRLRQQHKSYAEIAAAVGITAPAVHHVLRKFS